jgi:hypothetical protein
MAGRRWFRLDLLELLLRGAEGVSHLQPEREARESSRVLQEVLEERDRGCG